MMLRSLVNGVSSEHIALEDRGFNYGDGVFETILIADGVAVWWEAHLARLRRGCDALRIECPPAELLSREVQSLMAGDLRMVLKLTVTRGVSGRGYGAASDAAPTRVLTLHPTPRLNPIDYCEGIALRWCDTRLAIQPRLAGIKHLNRLEQVLARSEWTDAALAEGLMRDFDGRAVCATAANLFLVRDGRVLTPALERCGIAGVCRAWVLQHLRVQVCDLIPTEIESADELFLTSSLRGILPVARLDGRRWTPGAMTQQLQHALWREVPALRPQPEVLT